MAGYTGLKETIDTNIRTNGRQAITGELLNRVLNLMVQELGAGATFSGIAGGDTLPAATDGNAFWIAGPGEYPNFGLTVPQGNIGILYNSSGEWQGKNIGIVSVDGTVDEGSGNPVSGDAVHSALVALSESIEKSLNEIRTNLIKEIEKKVDKEEGKGLSSNDFTDTDKEKLDGLSNYDDSGIKRSISELQTGKQNTLVSGTNIKTINGESILGPGNMTLDLSLYKVVESLPEMDIDPNKIYLVLNTSGEDGNEYTEYVYLIDTWEELGTYKATVDLTPYLKKEDAAQTYATKIELMLHTYSKNNPHAVTKEQVGLGNVDNTADADKPVSTAQKTALGLKQDKTDEGLETTDKTVVGGINEVNAALPYVINSALLSHTAAEGNEDLVNEDIGNFRTFITALRAGRPIRMKTNDSGRVYNSDVWVCDYYQYAGNEYFVRMYVVEMSNLVNPDEETSSFPIQFYDISIRGNEQTGGLTLYTQRHLNMFGGDLSKLVTSKKGILTAINEVYNARKGLSGSGKGGEIFNDYPNVSSYGNRASGSYSHAEGYYTEASGSYSHAEGCGYVNIGRLTASGSCSHAEGFCTEASGNYSHAEGYYNIASNDYEHVEGKYNASHTGMEDSDKTIHSVGIGLSVTRKNAHEIMVNGDHYIYGIGGYDGINYQSAKTLQEVVNTSASQLGDVQGILEKINNETL